jgi:hypothetical protein
MTRGAVPARSKGYGHKILTVEKRQWNEGTKEYGVQEAPIGRTSEKRRRMQMKISNGIRDRSLKHKLCLENERAFNKTVR